MTNRPAPHVRDEETARHMTADMLMITVPLCAFSVFLYGFRPVLTVLLSMVSALVCEAGCSLWRRQGLKPLLDGSAAVTGAIVGLVMSPLTSYWVPMLGSAFAILVAKAPFGGYGRNVFNPAAAGIAIVSYCFPKRVFTYPAISSVGLPLGMNVDMTKAVTQTSLATQLRTGVSPSLTPMDMLVGDFSGPIGATATIILLAGMLYLLFRRTASPWLIIPYVFTCVLAAFLFPYAGVGRFYSSVAQLCSGYVLFTGVYLLNDPVTTPRFWLGRLFYGIFAGILVMLLQHIGRVDAGSCFAILIMNVVSPMIDRWSWHIWRYFTRRFRVKREVNAHE